MFKSTLKSVKQLNVIRDHQSNKSSEYVY
uniref:Uncharacterized protein n=1 Tax=Anguilla anguilla TaxID=7936 RepID=A0A0E9XW85_ANGAN